MSSKKKSSQKKNLLEEYITKTNAEINEKAISSLKPIYKDADILTIDDNIKPLLLVLSSDITGGNHNQAIEQAAILKVSLLSISAIQIGESPKPAIPDINSILPMIQGTLTMLPSIVNCTGSLIECIGKNITQGRDDTLFQYGLAMNTGARIGNMDKAHTLQEIGVCVGCIDMDRDKQTQYQKFSSLVKTLPRNKFTKRLKELVDLMMRPADTNNTATTNTEKESSQKEEIRDISKDITQTYEPNCADGTCVVKFATSESDK